MGDISQARIVSAVLGRVRLKVPRRPGMLEIIQRTADALNPRSGVTDVQVNPRTGSILVRYDPERGNLGDLRVALQHSGIKVSEEGILSGAVLARIPACPVRCLPEPSLVEGGGDEQELGRT